MYVNSQYGTYALARDTGTGALTLIERKDFAAGKTIEITPDGGFIYVGGLPPPPHFGPTPPADIRGYRRDLATGRLSPVPVDRRLRTIFSGDIAVSPDGRQLYLSDTVPGGDTLEDVLRTFSRDPGNGALAERLPAEHLGPLSPTGKGLAMSADGRWLHVGHRLFERSSDGSLRPVDDYTCYGCGAQTLLLNEAGDRLYAGPFRTAAHIRDPATASVTLANSPSGTAGFFWESPGVGMALAGASLYAVQTRRGVVEQSRVTPEGLEYVREYRHSTDAPQGLEHPRSIAISPDGRHAYVAATSYGSDSSGALLTTIATFVRDPASGDLAFASLWTEPPPFGPGLPPAIVRIEDGAAFTNDPRVKVRASAPRGGLIELSNDRHFGPSSRRFEHRRGERYPWRLATRRPRSRRRAVYVRQVYPAGSGFGPSAVVKDQIVLDQRSPRLLAATVRRGRGGRLLFMSCAR